MKSAAIFVHSYYPKAKMKFYKKLCLGKYKIAVDGGYSFFKKSGVKPDIIIGDFDSLKKVSLGRVKILSYPTKKDATDAELAVKYCIEKRFKSIDIVVPSVGDPDHFLGLVALLLTPQFSSVKIKEITPRIINHKCEIFLLKNLGKTFTNCKNELLTIMPFGGPIEISCQGMEYPAKRLSIKPWQTIGMRNVICSNQAKISIKGTALVIHYWNKSS